ncbi:hypothetical protein [Vogesella sp. XCS3]|uniref:hypothetical protein n=1 Tax=Vogesella sp. XCS3 TaxID=2877939 RepID=UPI001D09E4D7|nr:hypothetical protein [Vogesella sp. XCS3]UDM18983.1 hypothetical protein LCH97_18235 [Vogesella sp. XCS3]
MAKKQILPDKYLKKAKEFLNRIPYEGLQACVGILIFLAGMTVGAAWSDSQGKGNISGASEANMSYAGHDGQGRPQYIVRKESLW